MITTAIINIPKFPSTYTMILYIIVFLTAIGIMLFDYKLKKIPMWLLLINYTAICLMVNYWLLFGIIVIILARIKDFPIDWLYVCLMMFMIIFSGNPKIIHIVTISLIIIYMFVYSWINKDDDDISYMLPLEMSLIFELFAFSAI